LCAEVDQYKDILKKFKDYDEDILKQRMRYAEKDREAEKLRVSAWVLISLPRFSRIWFDA